MFIPPRRAATPVRLRAEPLEGRDVPTTLVGLTTADTLVTFDSASPGTTSSPVVVLGLLATEDLVGIDFRPSTGQLYGVVRDTLGMGNDGRLVVIDPTTGVTTTVGGGGYTFDLTGTAFGVDFNPVPDLVRVTSDAGQSLRVNPTTGALVGTDTAPFFDPTNDPANGFTNPGFFDANADGDFDPATNPPTLPATLAPTGVGYTTRVPGVAAGTFVTTLYAIDSANDLLVRVGGPDGTPSPNAGQAVAVEFLRDDATGQVIDFGPQNGFDVETGTDAGFATTGTGVYAVDLATASATSLGTVGGGLSLRGLAVGAPAAGAGTVQLAATALRFPADRGPLAVTVTRTGGATGTVTVDFATADGTAVAGRDYLPASGTLTFNPGETTRTIFLSLPATATPGPAPERAFTLTLSNPGGGGTLGGNQTATVTVPAVAPTTTSGRRFVAGQGAGGSQVAVYDAVSGAAAFTFTPFGAFAGGVRVAAGDVNGDGVDDVIVGAGPGGGPRVAVYDGATLSAANQTVIANVFVYEATFTGGVYVAAGDVNGDGADDLVLGAGLGGGPRVRVLDGATLTSTSQTVVADFFAFESTFRGGVFVAAGEFTGDAFDDVVAGAAVGGGPRVEVFNLGFTGTGGPGAPAAGPANPTAVANYFAYDSSFRNGVFVAAGDVNADGRLDVVTGPGFGGGPDVRAFSGITSTQLGGFFAFDAGNRSGAPVATADLNADGRDEILVGFGPAGTGGAGGTTGTAANGGGRVRVFDATGATVLPDLQPFGPSFTGGVFVG